MIRPVLPMETTNGLWRAREGLFLPSHGGTTFRQPHTDGRRASADGAGEGTPRALRVRSKCSDPGRARKLLQGEGVPPRGIVTRWSATGRDAGPQLVYTPSVPSARLSAVGDDRRHRSCGGPALGRGLEVREEDNAEAASEVDVQHAAHPRARSP